ncbi:type VI secretion system-associated protein TagO [Moritella sp.]|uniref:type VI secretion system-associated protein TagO n=1 Tax=Moritella sp. TaxID=78556 RepID=UPI0025CE309B|nr:type VI secretion system-associated protein TagO [Moritella sp.]MCJ8350913.1 type VI secretion protein [Moritella sp.]
MMRQILLVAASLLLAANANAAINEKEYAKCAIVEGDQARLECFDNLTAAKKLNVRQVKPASFVGKGKWYVSVDGGSKAVTLTLNADSGKNRWGKPVYLVVRCKSNTTDLYIGWNDYLGREASVLTRVGTNKAITQSWSMSTDKNTTYHNEPIPFIKELLDSSKLVTQVTLYNESSVTAVFNTAGLANIIQPLRDRCGW